MPELIFQWQVLNNHIRHIHHAPFYETFVFGRVISFSSVTLVRPSCNCNQIIINPTKGSLSPNYITQHFMLFKVVQHNNNILISTTSFVINYTPYLFCVIKLYFNKALQLKKSRLDILYCLGISHGLIFSRGMIYF